jgi:hypothetical protein
MIRFTLGNHGESVGDFVEKLFSKTLKFWGNAKGNCYFV